MTMNFERARQNMVEQQVRTWEVLDSEVLSVLETVHREDFVPVRYRKLAFADLCIPLGHGQTVMTPTPDGGLVVSGLTDSLGAGGDDLWLFELDAAGDAVWQTAVGGTLSSTVTVAVAVETLPFTSVTVSVTVLAPTLAQVKSVLSRAVLAMPQASLLPLLIAVAVVEPLPPASSCTVTSWQVATGATLSSTVTVAVQVAVLLLLSVTVRVTVLAPTLAQVKSVGLAESVTGPSPSKLPLSMSAAVMEALPLASSWTVMSWQMAVGPFVSSTVMVAVQVLVLPLLSVTVSSVLVTPTVLKVDGLMLRLAMPQASLLPLLTSPAVSEAEPVASS